MANPSQASVSSRCSKYANACRRGELSPEAAAIESRKIDESRLYLYTREPDESLGQWRKRAPILEHLQHAVDAGILVGGTPRVLLDPEFAALVLGTSQLTLV